MRSYYTGERGIRYFNHYYDTEFNQEAGQRKAGSLSSYISSEWSVLDFGCGTGSMLANINCRERIGVEINPLAIAKARENGLSVFSDLHEVSDARVDAAIAHHSLEHVDRPADVLDEFLRVLRPGGALLVIVPAENPLRRPFCQYRRDDINMHLYSWTPLSLGNLIESRGFEVDEIQTKTVPVESRYVRLLSVVPGLEIPARRLRAWLLQHYEIICCARKNHGEHGR